MLDAPPVPADGGTVDAVDDPPSPEECPPVDVVASDLCDDPQATPATSSENVDTWRQFFKSASFSFGRVGTANRYESHEGRALGVPQRASHRGGSQRSASRDVALASAIFVRPSMSEIRQGQHSATRPHRALMRGRHAVPGKRRHEPNPQKLRSTLPRRAATNSRGPSSTAFPRRASTYSTEWHRYCWRTCRRRHSPALPRSR